MDLDEDTKKILESYGKKLDSTSEEVIRDLPTDETFSREYEIFRKELLDKKTTIYENLCNFSEGIIKIKPKPKDEETLQKSIKSFHLEITPIGAYSFAVIVAGIFILIATIIALSSFFLGEVLIFTPLFLLTIGALIIKPISNLPNYLANRHRLKASNQMVLCILYVVMYMRHTSNLERAIKFAGEHIGNPLALDLRKVFWDVETDKYSTIRESIDHYLEDWKDYNLEFVEAFHLIESSLHEPNEGKRITLLDKSLEVMLDGTYERMLHFAHELKSPITMLHMLGVILPILGIVIFPLIASFLSGAVKWWHLSLLYNFLLPPIILIFGMNILSKRITGFGETDLFENNPEIKKYRNDTALLSALLIGFVFLLIGFMPIILHLITPEFDQVGFLEGSIGGKILDYKCLDEVQGSCNSFVGPYGLWALVLSLLIPLGLGLAIGTYYKLNTKNIIDIKKETDKLEREFTGSLFQLGNRVGSGIPVELAFERVSQNLEGTPTGSFFRIISINIRKLGMGLNDAIFNKERGAIIYFPSKLIESSMKVLIESSKKGPEVVSKSLISISVYADRIHKVGERLKDLLADITSSMQAQSSFLAPMIAGIVIGVSSMVVSIINKLGEQFKQATLSDTEGVGNLGGLVQILRIEDVVPSFHFQLVVGIYILQIVIILTILRNAIENNDDKIIRKFEIGKNLFFSMILYFIVSLIGIFIFNILANGINVITSAT
ncbi:MAG: hypothetical protein QGF74_00845 [Candidatus Nanoarchaeia archaeon]|jgi:hypothetical protein|nr:hypothetical protein [Candidatus Nanoarchaeia archaeon]|tara:strand:+ start:20533 stop:22698 length:2166 start_codon:yes stop_codon:yes gene_type:complete